MIGKLILGIFISSLLFISGCIYEGVDTDCIEGSGNVVTRKYILDEFNAVVPEVRAAE